MHNYSKMHDILLFFACGILCVPCLVLTGIPAENTSTDQLTAMQILERAAATYAACNSYRDSGVVTEEIAVGSKRYATPKSFRTAFIRPNQFRFESDIGPYIIWANGSEVLTWWRSPGIRKPSSLSLGIAGASGVSSGSAHTIPALLLPDRISGNKISKMTDLMRLPDETINGAPCFKLEGKLGPFKQPMTLWFERATFLLRRIVAISEFAITTTDYRPELNKEITPEELEFNAPKAQ